MTFIKNNEGIALVTSLMLTLISLTMVMALLYIVTQGITQSAQLKKYKTALDASYGGTEIVVKDIFPAIMQNYSSSSLVSTVQSAYGSLNLEVKTTQDCLQKKLTLPTAQWPTSCSNASNPKNLPDLSFKLQASAGSPFIVYSKIVDTVYGNTDTSGLQLEGAGVAESSSLLTPQHFPYIYRMEVQGERENNPTAQANIEVLYAY
jgi:hypothetical protein